MELALAIAVVLSVAVPAAAGPRVPGLALRFGDSLARVDSTGNWTTPARHPGTDEVRTSPSRFFGVPGDLTLHFADGRLVRAEAVVKDPSPHDRDYVRDELRRMGLRAVCEVDEPDHSRCVWSGRAIVTLDLTPAKLQATMQLAPDPAAARAAAAPGTVHAAAAAPPPLAGPPPAFVLDDSAAAAPFPVPEVVHREEPVYPAGARKAGVMGRVRVRALVDSTGAVSATEIARSIPLLDAAASACVRRWRFRPYQLDGRAWAFRIEVPILFTLR